MATILVSSTTSYYFANDWEEMLVRFSLSEFHSSEFNGRRGEFEGWTDDRRRDLQAAIIGLLLKWQVKHSAALVPNAVFKQSFVETKFNETIAPAKSKWKKPYLLAFQHTVADLREYTDQQPEGSYIIPTFDNCQEFMNQARQYYEQRNGDGKLGKMHVRKARREYVQLQAADFLVWQYRVMAEHFIKTGDRDPGPILGPLKNNMFRARLWSRGYLDYLRERVDAVRSGLDPETVPAPDTRTAAGHPHA